MAMNATMGFLAASPVWGYEKPYELFIKTHPQFPKSNCKFEDSTVSLKEIRSAGESFTLERDGFECVRRDFQFRPRAADLEDPTEVKTAAIPLLEETQLFLKAHLGAEQVICFDWRVRVQGRPRTDLTDLADLTNIRNEAIRPAKIVHTDYSWDGGEFKVKQHLQPEEITKYCSDRTWRVRLINVWRPLIPVIYNYPLAFCHPRSVNAADLVEKDNVHPHNVVGSLYLLHRPYHEWFYMREQRAEEAWIFVSWDADESPEQPRCPPHCSFELPDIPSGVLPRESVEVRFIVITKREQQDHCNASGN